MGTKAGVGVSHHRNPVVAGREAAEQAMKSAGVDSPDFVFMFASIGYDQRALLKAVRDATKHAPLSGCSGEGVIAGYDADESNFAVGVMALKSDELRFENGLAAGLQKDSVGVGRAIAQQVKPRLRPDTVGLFLFPDGLTINFDRLTTGLQEELQLDRFLPLWGGTAGENFQWDKTYQFCDDEVVSDGVAFALLSGNVQVAWAVNHGCIAIGLERKITRAEGNVIYEVDGKPILEVLKEYLTEEEIDNWTTAVVTLSLGLKAPGFMEDQDEYIIRAMVGGKDDATGSITIPTEVKQGSSIWMTRRDQEKVALGLDRVAAQINSQLDGHQPKFVFQFDCGGRGKMLFRDQQKLQLLRTLRQSVSPDAPWLGFYSYAEIGPVGGHNCIHNYTAVLTALY